MQTIEEARELGELMVSIAHRMGRRAVALLSDMNQPLGHAVGNSLEVREAIQTLHGGGPADFREHCLVVAGHMLAMGGMAADEAEGRLYAQKSLDEGLAWERFKSLVTAQGGDIGYIADPDRLPGAAYVENVPAPRSGYIREIQARIVGETAVLLGGGRAKKGDPIDHAVGIEIYAKVGDRVEAGQPLFAVHANNEAGLFQARQILLGAIQLSDEPVEPLPLFYGVIRDRG
jgi:pyrimidine-nucleoside phosphorylase